MASQSHPVLDGFRRAGAALGGRSFVLPEGSVALVVRSKDGLQITIGERALPIVVPAHLQAGDQVRVSVRPDGEVLLSLARRMSPQQEAIVRILQSIRELLPRRPLPVPASMTRAVDAAAFHVHENQSLEETRRILSQVVRSPGGARALLSNVNSAASGVLKSIDAAIERLIDTRLPNEPVADQGKLSGLQKLEIILRSLSDRQSSVDTAPRRTSIAEPSDGRMLSEASSDELEPVARALRSAHAEFSRQQVERIREVLRMVSEESTIDTILRVVTSLERLLQEPRAGAEQDFLALLKELRELLSARPQGEVLRRILQDVLDQIVEKFVTTAGEPPSRDLSPRFATGLATLVSQLTSALDQIDRGVSLARALPSDTMSELLQQKPSSDVERKVHSQLRAVLESLEGGASPREELRRLIESLTPLLPRPGLPRVHMAAQMLRESLANELPLPGQQGGAMEIAELADVILPAPIHAYARIAPQTIATLARDYAVRQALRLVADGSLRQHLKGPLDEEFAKYVEQIAKQSPLRAHEPQAVDRAVLREGLQRLRASFLEEQRFVPQVREVVETQRLAKVLEASVSAQESMDRLLPLLGHGAKEGVLLFPLFSFGMLQFLQLERGYSTVPLAVSDEDGMLPSEEPTQRFEFAISLPRLGRISVEVVWNSRRIAGRFFVADERIKKFLARRIALLRRALLAQGYSEVDWSIGVFDAASQRTASCSI